MSEIGHTSGCRAGDIDGECSCEETAITPLQSPKLLVEHEAQIEQLAGAVDAYRDIVSWARATFDLADRPEYGDGIDRLLERHELEPLSPYRPHDRRRQQAHG